MKYSHQRTKHKPLHRQIKRNSLSISFLLILFAIFIVTGSRLVFPSEPPQPTSSYGSNISRSTTQTVPKNNKMVSQLGVKPGTIIDTYKGIPVYSNGQDYMSSHGLNYSNDGYYYGYMWQCVEYVKRFYYEKFGHKMPDGAGNAKYFFNPMLDQGEFNKQRGLKQYKNGGDEEPKTDDLLVFTDGAYGHVAIITEVGVGYIEVIQQNSEFPREKYTLTHKNGTYHIDGARIPAGWLRI